MDTVPLNATSLVNVHPSLQASAQHIYNDTRFIGDSIQSLYIIPFLAAVGVCGNVMNLVVWSAESGFKPTTFFFKALAVSDIVNLVSIVLFVLHVTGVISIVLAALGSTVSAHTTMAIAYVRLLSVKQPTRVKTLLPKYRVIGGYVLLLSWCILTWLPLIVTLQVFKSSDHPVAMFFSTAAGSLSLILPVVVTAILNIGLLKKLFEPSNRNALGQPLQHTVTRATRLARFRSPLTAVVCLSVTTVLAYPPALVIFALNIYSKMGFDEEFWYSDQETALEVSVVLVMFNASINVVYYLLFSSQFRQLLSRRLKCCVCRNDPPRDIPLNRVVT
ncbi:putative G-protein coupled receptor F59B2.13 [Littorina saxatilis]|uniref:putative G-protein coupled receptor F59B2.13 n=1 Tax=Littorina saxatilis TaxID=31220 RepID=UPI0038B4DDB3